MWARRRGVAAFTFEMGDDFFQDCPTFESIILPDNRAALLYAFKAARRPYQTPAGPDSLQATACSAQAARWLRVSFRPRLAISPMR